MAVIRGLRFSQTPPTATTTFEAIEPLSKRVAAFGWHVQIYMEADRIAAAEDLWNRFPTTLVFDHLGHLPQPAGVNHPAFAVLHRLLDKGRTWVKLSGAGIDTQVRPPTYADATNVAFRAYVRKPRPNAWYGAATGRTQTSPSTTSRTTLCCSICSLNGRWMSARAIAFWSRTPKACTALPSQPDQEIAAAISSRAVPAFGGGRPPHKHCPARRRQGLRRRNDRASWTPCPR